MSDQTNLNPGVGGDAVRTVDNSAYTTSAAVTAKTQVNKLDFGGETGEALVTTGTPLPTAGTGSYFVASTANSSSAQLAAGASFTGTIEAIPTALNLSLNIPTDEPLSVVVNFYEGSASNTIIGSYSMAVAAGMGLNRSIPTNGNYCNVVVTNTGTATTTLLNINAQYGAIPAIDQAGNTPVGVYGTQDLAGVNLLEAVVRGDLALNVRDSGFKTDAAGAFVLADMKVLGPFTATSITNSFTPAIDLTGYGSVYFQGEGGSASGGFQFSVDGINWQGFPFVYTVGGNWVPTTGAVPTTNPWISPAYARYVRVILTSYTSGPVGGYVILKQSPSPFQAASGSVDGSGPSYVTQVAARVVTTPAAGLTNASMYSPSLTSARQTVVKLGASVEADWQYNASISTTSSTAMSAAGAAGIRNYCTGFQYQNTSATASTISILDGATVVWQGNAPASMGVPANVTFQTPLHGTAATAMNVQLGTAVTSVIVCAQGYQSA